MPDLHRSNNISQVAAYNNMYQDKMAAVENPETSSRNLPEYMNI